MADRKKKSWGTFKNEMKVKRRKTGDGGGKKNEKGNILERQELVVQRLSSEVSGKAQKYTRVGPREFVRYDEEELSIEGIKAACEKHFSSSLERKGLSCDILAGEQGPSCHSMKQIPDFKVIHVRFIKTSSSPTWQLEDEYASSSSRQQCVSEPVTPPRPSRKNPENRAQSTGSSNVKQLFPKSLSISHMMKLGKLVKPNEAVSVLEVYSFDLENICWSLLPQKVEFVIEKDVLGSGGFRQAFKARSSSPNFNNAIWVVKKYLPRAAKEITEDIQITIEEHTKKVVQMHALTKNIADQLSKKVQELNVSKEFGETLKFRNIYLAKLDGECLTLEEFIEGKFEKYMNNTGEVCVSDNDVIGQKAECLSHFCYDISNSHLLVVDLQGSGHMLYDPEIATAKMLDSDEEFLFCAGNLNVVAIATFVKAHVCNKFCHLLGLKQLKQESKT